MVRERESSGSRGRSCLELAIGVVELNELTGEPGFFDGATVRVPVGVIPAGESSESLPELLDREVRADGGSQRIQLVERRAFARGQDPLWPTGWALKLVEGSAEPEALRAAAGELRINRVEMRGERIAWVASPVGKLEHESLNRRNVSAPWFRSGGWLGFGTPQLVVQDRRESYPACHVSAIGKSPPTLNRGPALRLSCANRRLGPPSACIPLGLC